jgi:hypothetical protein
MSRERVTMPVPVQGMGLCMSHVSSIMVAGYGCVGMGYAGFLGKWGGEREREENISKIFFSPVSAFAGEKNCTVPFKTAPGSLFFFFFKKRKMNGSDPKLGYDNPCGMLYNL